MTHHDKHQNEGGGEEIKDRESINKQGASMKARHREEFAHQEGHEGCDMCPSELEDREPGQGPPQNEIGKGKYLE